MDSTYGYHFAALHSSLQISHATLRQSHEAFDYQLDFNRQSTKFELITYLWDKQSFSPFLGAGYCVEKDTYREVDSEAIRFDRQSWDGNLVFTAGWEINPGRNYDWLALRTSIRFLPWFK